MVDGGLVGHSDRPLPFQLTISTSTGRREAIEGEARSRGLFYGASRLETTAL